ncbi:hypothetical protein [Bosea caraganae]|nr:hypothetical protein [Bosea caraganae]
MSRRPHLLAASLLCLGLAGCGSSSSSTGEPSAMQRTMNVLMFQSTSAPPAEQLPKDDEQDTGFVCPQVIIADGGAAIRAQAGQDSAGLRHQISILNVARECTPTGPGGGFRLKVGVEGRVLLGPAGGAGAYSATLNTQVMRGTTVVARRSGRVGGSIAAGQGGTDFTYVEDGIVVPPGRGDVEIIVGLSQGGAATPARARRR